MIRKRLQVGDEPNGLKGRRRGRHQVFAGASKRDGKFNQLRTRGDFLAPKDACLAGQRGKEVVGRAHGLGAAQHQDASGIEAVVEKRQELLLQVRLQVDEQVPTHQQVELGERWVHGQVLRGEDHHVSDFFTHPVAALLLHKKPAQPRLRDIRGDVGRISAGPGLGDGVLVQVGGKDLQRIAGGWFHLLERLAKNDGQRIGFLAR